MSRPFVDPSSLRPVIFALLALLGGPVMAQAPAREAASKPGCAERHLARATAFIQAGQPISRIAEALDEAHACPEGPLTYEVRFYQSMVRMRGGEIERSREEAAAAWKLARTPPQQRRAEALVEVLEQQFQEVHFVQSGDLTHRVNVYLDSVQQSTLPSDQTLGKLLPGTLSPLAEGAYLEVFRAAQERCLKSVGDTVQVWLPRGTYLLNTGQTVVAAPPGIQTFTLVDLRWSLVFSGAAMYTNVLRTGRDPGAVALAYHGSAGVQLSQAFRVRPRYFLTVDVGYYPSGFPRCHTLSDGSSDCETSEDIDLCDDGRVPGALCRARTGFKDSGYLANEVMVEAGLSRAVLLRQKSPLLLGLALRGMLVPNGLGVTYESTKDPGVVCNQLMAWYGALGVANARTYIPVKQLRGIYGGLVIGASLALGPGNLDPLAEEPDDPEHATEDQTAARLEGEEPNASSCPATDVSGSPLVITGGLQLGLSIRF